MIRAALVFGLGLALLGCGPAEDKKPEPQTSKDLSNQAAQGWTPEQKKAFEVEHAKERGPNK